MEASFPAPKARQAAQGDQRQNQLRPAETERDDGVDQRGVNRLGRGEQLSQAGKIVVIVQVGGGIELVNLDVSLFQESGQPEEGGQAQPQQQRAAQEEGATAALAVQFPQEDGIEDKQRSGDQCQNVVGEKQGGVKKGAQDQVSATAAQGQPSQSPKDKGQPGKSPGLGQRAAMDDVVQVVRSVDKGERGDDPGQRAKEIAGAQVSAGAGGKSRQDESGDERILDAQAGQVERLGQVIAQGGVIVEQGKAETEPHIRRPARKEDAVLQ